MQIVQVQHYLSNMKEITFSRIINIYNNKWYEILHLYHFDSNIKAISICSIILLWSQRDVTLSHFLMKSILRFSQLPLLLRFWEKHKRIKQKMFYRKRFRRSEKLKRIKRKTQNTKFWCHSYVILMSFWRKYDMYQMILIN